MSYAATLRQNYELQYSHKLDAQENRMPSFQLLQLGLKNRASANGLFTSEQIGQIESIFDRTIDVPVLDKYTAVLTNSRVCNITGGDDGDSDIVNLTFSTMEHSIKYIPSRSDYQRISEDDFFLQKYDAMQEAMGKEIETSIVTALEANKNQVVTSQSLVGAGTKYGVMVANAIQVDTTNAPFFFNDTETMQMEDDFDRWEMDFVGSAGLKSIVDQIFNQGAGNQTNTSFQFGNKNFTFSNSVQVTAGSKATGFFMPVGSFVVLVQLHPDNIANRMTGSKKWYTDKLPLLGNIPVEVYEVEDCADVSGADTSAKNTRNFQKVMSFAFDYSVAIAYNSNVAGKAAGIKKFDFLN
jgi:hypothetical protein